MVRVRWVPPVARWPRSSARSPKPLAPTPRDQVLVRNAARASAQPAACASPRRHDCSAAGAGPNIDAMVADVRQRMTEGKLIDPPGDSARDSARRTCARPRRIVRKWMSCRARCRRVCSTPASQAMNAKAFERSAQLLAAAKDVGQRFNGAAISQAEADLTAARDATARCRRTSFPPLR